MSHKEAKRRRKVAALTPSSGRRSEAELLSHLKEQLAFLRASAASFDSGFEGEAKRLATVIRVLVHDTVRSRALLSQLGLLGVVRFVDTAVPINPRNLLPTEGLVMLRVVAGEASSAVYIPPLGDGPPERYGRTRTFNAWWTTPVTKLRDGRLLSRRDYVLPVANSEGGAHVDPKITPMFDEFLRRNPFGWEWEMEGGPAHPVAGNAALAAVRQIAYEVEETLRPLVAERLRVSE